MGLVSRRPSREPGVPGPEPTLASMTDPDPDVRRRCALDLRACLAGTRDGDREAAATALLSAWSGETDPSVRSAILVALSAGDDVRVAGVLAIDLESEDAERRNCAVVALQAMPSAMGELAPTLLAHPVARVRVLTIMVLAGLQDPRVAQWLDPVVAGDHDQNVVAAAVDAALAVDAGAGAGLLDTARARFPDDPYLAFLSNEGTVAR